MTNFRKLLCPTLDDPKNPEVIEYKGKKIFGFDRFPVKDKETLIFSIEKTNSKFIQGFAVGVFDGYTKTGTIRTNKRKFGKHLFWEDAHGYDPKNIDVKIFTKGNHITICNIWEIEVSGRWVTRFKGWGKGTEEVFKHYETPQNPCYYGSRYWRAGRGNGAAMYSEDIPGGKRYFCNDGDEDEDFDDIIFTVKRMN